jgi:hypothetical protein
VWNIASIARLRVSDENYGLHRESSMIQSCSRDVRIFDKSKLAERQGRKATGSNVRKNDDSLAAE